MAMAWATAPVKRFFDHYLLLLDAEQTARTRTEEQQASASRYYDGALRRTRAAREVMYSDTAAAIALYREAAFLLVTASLQGARAEKITPPASVPEAWRAFDELPEPNAYRKKPRDWAKAREILANEDPLVADALPQSELAAVAATVASAVGWLLSEVEPRTRDEIRVARSTRVLVSGLGALFALVLVCWLVFSRKNLADGAAVMASSQRPGTPPPSGVVNGTLEHDYGVHTNSEANPWVRIDLGNTVTIREVRVYNRADGYENEILPLVMQLSDDGDNYEDVAERTELFTQEAPWIVKLDKKRARYVRIYMPQDGYIALSEIEVY